MLSLYSPSLDKTSIKSKVKIVVAKALTNGLKHDIIMISKLSLVTLNTQGGHNMIYGYCRVSTKHQRITRQVTNIKELHPTSTIIKEFYTGTTQNRPRWDKVL